MKKYLTLIVAVGMVSSFTSGMVSGNAENRESAGYSSSGFAYINPDLYKKENNTKGETAKTEAESKKKKGKSSGISKTIKSALYYGVSGFAAHEFTNKIGYTNNENISRNYNNLVNIVKNSSNAKEFVKNVMANPDAMNTLSDIYYIVPTCATIGGIVGSIGSFAFGVSGIGGLVGTVLGVVVALGATGKSFFNTAIIPGLSKVIDLLPFGNSSSSK